eukprot:6067291-Alexandrium_andersonii.AAC.1
MRNEPPSSSGEALIAMFALSASNGAELAHRELRGPSLSPLGPRHPYHYDHNNHRWMATIADSDHHCHHVHMAPTGATAPTCPPWHYNCHHTREPQ